MDDFLKNASESEKIAVANFQRYLRIPTVHPDVDYLPCVNFLREQAEALGLVFNVHYYHEDVPVIVLTWQGSQPQLPSILLNSHMDVVAADERQWKFKPFAAEVDDEGNIHARGTQDTKGIGIQYLEAIRQLKKSQVAPLRNVHVTFVPDEEIGGARGMKAFVHSKEFEVLNVGFALDEGTATEDDEFLISYAEKSAYTIVIHFPGQSGHASLLLKDTAGEKLNFFLNKLYELRAKSDRLVQGRLKLYGEHITVNVTQIEGGTEANVLPSEIRLTIDCRLPPSVSLESWEETLDGWCRDAGAGVWMEHLNKSTESGVTKLDDDNKFWVAFRDAAEELNMNLVTWVLPGGTDSRYLRNVEVPAIGFSPLRFTKFKMHEVDEYLNIDVFLQGIQIYAKLILAIANVT
ncbi:hypothetical protein FQR65_LT13987 [Abscondita terminalis]|nr:hypothetical protein FQR65_LT13987 [Abscondita terminalis]